MQSTKIESKVSAKLQFLLLNFEQIVELEKTMKFVLSQAEIKKNPYLVLKLYEGGWIPFKDVFKLQKIFDEEKTFFQALNFIKRVEICQSQQTNVQKNSSDSLVLKLNESFGDPQLNFYIKKKDDNVDELKNLVEKSTFHGHYTDFQVIESNEKENQKT